MNSIRSKRLRCPELETQNLYCVPSGGADCPFDSYDSKQISSARSSRCIRVAHSELGCAVAGRTDRALLFRSTQRRNLPTKSPPGINTKRRFHRLFLIASHFGSSFHRKPIPSRSAISRFRFSRGVKNKSKKNGFTVSRPEQL